MPTTQSPEDYVRVIACDESGSESATLLASQHPVFVHTSVNLPLDSATEIRDGLSAATRTQPPETKSKITLRPRHRAVLLELIDNLADTGNISLVDKSYFLTSKLIETIIGPHAEQWATNIGISRKVESGRNTWTVMHQAPSALVGGTRSSSPSTASFAPTNA